MPDKGRLKESLDWRALMANAEQIKALLRSHMSGDEEWFYSIALQVAAQAARQGQGRYAKEIRELILDAKKSSPRSISTATAIPIDQPRGELSGLLSVAYPKTLLSHLILPSMVRSRLERVLLEQREASKIRLHGLSPRHRVLLYGPPGSGKTMTASALAGEMQLPLFTIQLDGLITKYMGETAAKLRIVFDAIRQNRGVYFFDEFDALGGQRTLGNDVGEIRRVLNSFLQFIEQDDSDSIIVAATNHRELLDKALFRRFDDVIAYSYPDEELAHQLFQTRLGILDVAKLDWQMVLEAAKGLSYADIAQACDNAAKESILKGQKAINTDSVLNALQERREVQL